MKKAFIIIAPLLAVAAALFVFEKKCGKCRKRRVKRISQAQDIRKTNAAVADTNILLTLPLPLRTIIIPQ